MVMSLRTIWIQVEEEEEVEVDEAFEAKLRDVFDGTPQVHKHRCLCPAVHSLPQNPCD